MRAEVDGMVERRDEIERVAREVDVLAEHVDLDGRRILELGCGRAELTREIAGAGANRSVLALEVDEVQHAKNLALDDLAGVTFALGGAESIPADARSFDVVLLFKSLHHVPVPMMDRALDEIARVLAPGGKAWISEPVFAGDFNEVLRLFHDESRVRAEAFAALRRAVARGPLELERELFFRTPVTFDSFDAFDEQVLRVTHTRHRLDDELLARVRARFHDFAGPDGAARFLHPIRVDLLRNAG